MRSEPTEEYHQLQLREKPSDPNIHSNYGAFLKDKRGDDAGAERAYAKALELDPNHVNALGNLGNLRWEQGDTAAAEALYRRALARRPYGENVTFNFARFLATAKNDPVEASGLLRDGIADNPDSGRLHLLLGELTLQHGDASQAVGNLRLAREKGADQARVECALACALHIVGADVGECLAAYQVAVALNPNNAALKLNLAQLLFLRRDDQEAIKQLQDALRIGLDEDAMLEAKFYQLAHTPADPASLLQDVAERIARGVRLSWNVLPNIERVRAEQAQKADLLESVRKVMIGEQPPATFARVLRDWPTAPRS
jgi:Flp pilus assembly protein TadD